MSPTDDNIEGQTPGNSPLDFIDSEKRWDKALFTTYALSLTYFETYVLPKLRRAGCEQIWILTDVEGYKASLMELRSRHVGQEYSLIPISVRTGIFHPKLTYLWGPEEDMLLVGSGNLTFGGHGQNVEVLEVLSPRTDATAFADFAGFLTDLAAKETITIAEKSALGRFSDRASARSNNYKDVGSTRLLHSLSVPIGEQLLDLARKEGAWNELLVLSPFHNPEGKPIKQLVDGLDVRRVLIGVPSSPTEPSSFPYDKAKHWDAKIEFVAPKVERQTRRLHAKWLELRGSKNWSLTGSVNATTRSMDTIENVEVAVLRVLKEPTSAQWRKAKKPEYHPDVMAKNNFGSSLVVFAELDGKGMLSGRVFGSGNLSGNWEAFLESADEMLAEDIVNVAEDGTLHWRLPKLFEFESTNAPQLRLIRDDVTARGWLSIQSLLKLPSRSRSALSALTRMLNRSESQDDIRALLDYIALHAGKLASLPVTRGPTSPQEPDKLGEDFVIEANKLVIHEGDKSEADIFRGLASSAHDENRSWEVLHAITKLLLGKKLHGPTSGAGTKKTPISRRVVEDEEDENDVVATRDALEEFNTQVQGALASAEEESGRRGQLMFVWGNVNLDMYLRRLSDRDGAFEFCRIWLLSAIRATGLTPEERALMRETVFGMATALAWHAKETSQGPTFVFGINLTKQLVHEWLEAYCQGPVEASTALRLASEWLSHETARLLVDDDAEAAVEALRVALECPTNRQVLAKIVKAVESGEPFEIPERFFNMEEEGWLKALAKNARPKLQYCRVRREKPTCACYVSFIQDTLTRLRTRRLAQCLNCKRILVSLEA